MFDLCSWKHVSETKKNRSDLSPKAVEFRQNADIKRERAADVSIPSDLLWKLSKS